METTEPTEAAAVAEPSNPPDNSSEQASRPPEQPTAAGPPNTDAAVNGTTAAAKPTSATAPTKKQPLSKTESASGSRPGMTSRHPVNHVRPTNSVAARTAPVKKPPTASTKPQGAAAVPKKTLGGASGSTSTAKTQVKMPDKKPTGPADATAAVTNDTKPANGTPKKTLAATKPRTTVPLSRPTGPTAPKPGTSSSTKPDSAAPMKTSRPATAAAAPTSRPAAKPSTAAAVAKPPSTAKTSASRAATAPSSGRATAAHPNKATAPAKKDISRPPAAAAVAKKTATTTSTATKKTEVSKSVASVKSSTASAKVDVKPQPKLQQSKPSATKKPAAVAARFPAVNKVGQTPPGSPVSKSSSSANTPQSKQAHKPTQAVTRFTAGKRTEKMGAAKAAVAPAASNKADAPSEGEVSATVAPMAAAAVVQETQVEAVAPLPQGLKTEATEPVKESAQTASLETIQKETESNTVSAPQSPVRSASQQIEQQKPSVPSLPTDEPASAESSVSPVALLLQPEAPITETQTSHLPKPTAVAENGSPQVIPPDNFNEDEEEEEKEGSQLVSVSEMSGTTQPTEESRPGSTGPVGASAWRVGGALLSELDSEEVSVSQQGASELSAPGVLEGTESMDDLAEGSLKGAMDMEGASAGSPDFEKVPEIPVNDYDEDDEEEDDNDRVCDMDVGSERTDEPQRLRHDNDVDDEEDEDVEMASEGVTESGLESYGNADEDDFAEDERLDNLNRVAQPPPPPLLPSAPAAQWDQPNPFIDPWAEPVLQPHPPELDSQSGQGAEVAADSPLTDPCQGDSETPTQEPAQTWLELGSATFTNQNQEFPQTSSDKKDEHTPEPQMYLEQPSATAEPTLSVSPPCAPGTSPLSIINSGTSTPDEVNAGHSEKDVLSSQLEPAHRGEPEGAPVDEVLGSAHAPASNPSSSSVTEDEASDMEGEAQLEDSLETPVICNVTFESQPHGQRCLSTVDEGEEPEDSGAAEDATPPSATSQVSYGFDITSASNSNPQSTGESCVKSPGIFSLEELPEEAKEPPVQPCVPEQPYIECGKGEVDFEQPIDNKMANSDKVCSPSPEPQQLEQMHPLEDIQPPYYSAICEKTENSFAGNV